MVRICGADGNQCAGAGCQPVVNGRKEGVLIIS
jgi:hypothetical protein